MQIAAPAVSEVTVSSRRTFAFRGVLLLIFGLAEGGLVLFWYQVPYVTSSPLTFVLAAFLLADGLAMLVESVIVLRAIRSPLTAFAWWASATGLLEAWAPLSLHDGTAWRITMAALSVALG